MHQIVLRPPTLHKSLEETQVCCFTRGLPIQTPSLLPPLAEINEPCRAAVMTIIIRMVIETIDTVPHSKFKIKLCIFKRITFCHICDIQHFSNWCLNCMNAGLNMFRNYFYIGKNTKRIYALAIWQCMEANN